MSVSVTRRCTTQAGSTCCGTEPLRRLSFKSAIHGVHALSLWNVIAWHSLRPLMLLCLAPHHRFLPVFKGLGSIVLKSDALRAFILHTYGGVYLDLDTECFQPVGPTLQGHSLVFQAEEDGFVNNAQMASVPGHPFWWLLIKRAVLSARQGNHDPLYAAGPHALTAALKEYLGQLQTSSVAGTFVDKWAVHHHARSCRTVAETAAMRRQHPDQQGRHAARMQGATPRYAGNAESRESSSPSSSPGHPSPSVDGSNEASWGQISGCTGTAPTIRVYGTKEWFTPCTW